VNVTGVVILDLTGECWADGEFVGRPATIPAGIRVRVLLGDAADVSLTDCRAIASRVWSADSVEVVGSDPRGIRSLADYLRADERRLAS